MRSSTARDSVTCLLFQSLGAGTEPAEEKSKLQGFQQSKPLENTIHSIYVYMYLLNSDNL